MKEKIIPNTNNRYAIREDGTVINIKRNREVKHTKGRDGYPGIVLTGADGKQHHFYVHRLLAEAFIPNPNNYPEINHKDENRNNYDLDNLEWCTRRYNCIYNDAHKRRGISVSATVKQSGGPHNKGKPMSEKQKKKISESCKGRPFFGNQYVKVVTQGNGATTET